MSLVDHAKSGPSVVLPGDVVFSVGKFLDGAWRPKEKTHSGLCIEETTYSHGDACGVAHIDDLVARDKWGTNHEKYVVDLSGRHPELDDSTRALIVLEALRYADLTLHPKVDSQYFMGPPSLDRFPPWPAPGYAFTCATFVVACFKVAFPDGFDLVDSTACPFVTADDLKRWVELWGQRHVSEVPFRRVAPVYLMAAFAKDQYPFSATDWPDISEFL